MPLLNLTHSIAGRYKIWTEEKAICRRVARRSLGKEARAAFAAAVGHEFTGSHEDRLRLAAPDRDRVDRGILKAMRRHPRAWKRSAAVARPVDRPETDNLILNQLLDQLGSQTTYYGGGSNGIMRACVLGTGTATPAVTDTALGTEVKRTETTLSTLLTYNNPTRTATWAWVYDFSAETVNRNYTEVALARYTTAGANIGTRALLSGGTVTVLIGQQARVAYSLSVTLPANATATPPVTGDTAGFGSSAGELVYCTLGAADPNLQMASSLMLSIESTKPAFGTAFGGGLVISTTSGTRTYTAGSFKSVRWASFNMASANRTDWRAILPYVGAPSDGSFAFVFDSAKTKDNLHTLTIDWSITYGRA